MEKLKELFKSYLGLFSLLAYGLGLVYMTTYYYYFNVPIIYYLSLNDMLLFAVNLIIPTLIAITVGEFIVITFARIVVRIYGCIRKKEAQYYSEARFNLVATILIFLTLVICMFFVQSVRVNPNVMFYLIISSFSLIAKLEYNLKDEGTRNGIIVLPAIGMAIGIYLSISFGRQGFANKEVQFIYNGEEIKTSFRLGTNYIGETSSTIFLYNFHKNVTYTYEKANITNLIYLDKIDKDYNQEKKVKLYAIKEGKYKFLTDTVYKPYQWVTHDKKTYVWTAEKNALGLSRLIWEVNYVLDDSNLDFNDPTHSHSSLPIKMKIEDDFKVTSDIINSGNADVHREWENSSGKIEFRLYKDYYAIRVALKEKNSSAVPIKKVK